MAVWILCCLGLVFVGFLFAQGCINQLFVHKLRPGAVSDEKPLVSILIPARNEQDRIGPCLRSLMAQTYPATELILLDDQSEDGTLAVAGACGLRQDPAARFRWHVGAPLPEGWTGKTWACHQLSQIAKGRYLLFTDADTRHHPAAVAAAIDAAIRYRADLLTAWPRQDTETWAEKAFIPLMYVGACTYLPHWLLAWAEASPGVARLLGSKGTRGLGSAIGQFLLFRRETYFECGGHSTVRSHLVEDVALGRLVAAETAKGRRLVSCDGTDLIRCRMYSSMGELWEGFRKNLWPLFENDHFGFWLLVLCQLLFLLLPFVLLPFDRSGWVLGLVLAILTFRALLAWRFHNGFWTVLLHPIGYLMGLIIALNSYFSAWIGGVSWKGRRYATDSKVISKQHIS
jgi:chlorobactene glucosyltransferase